VRRKTVSGIMLSLLLIGMLILTFNIQPVKASGTIYIKVDGSVDPPTANITTVDNITYTFTDNINDSIVVERDDIVVDGVGYTVQGTGSGTGISLSGRSNVTIKNMKIDAFDYGIGGSDLHACNIVGNTLTNIGSMAIGLVDSPDNIISGNNITNNGGYGILFLSDTVSVSNNIISGNNITNNSIGICSWFTGLDLIISGNIISGNNITNNRLWGITFYSDAYNNTISGNTISGNNITERGIWFRRSHNNTICGNNITSNWGVGVGLTWGSSNNTVNQNNITNNDVGIIVDIDAGNNIIYHNNFINNTQQVETFSSPKNIWDNGYPSGGNYWSDYTDVDLCNGPYQNLTDSDGIWDHPYIIDGNNQDNYPLVNPWTPPPTPTPVGGISIPVDKLSLLAPYIELTVLLAAAVVTAVYLKKRKRHTEITS